MSPIVRDVQYEKCSLYTDTVMPALLVVQQFKFWPFAKLNFIRSEGLLNTKCSFSPSFVILIKRETWAGGIFVLGIVALN